MVYVGSKLRLSRYIVPILQKIIKDYEITSYVEPFVGGANIIDKIICKNKYGYDSHCGLISIYKAAQKGWQPPTTITEQQYKEAKRYPEPLKSYIGFNGSFGSKYFGGFARGFKPNGSPRNIYAERTRRFIQQIPSLMDVDFECRDYRSLQVKNSLVYCDPPYEGTVKYKNTSFNHLEFWEWARGASKNNIILISEFPLLTILILFGRRKGPPH